MQNYNSNDNQQHRNEESLMLDLISQTSSRPSNIFASNLQQQQQQYSTRLSTNPNDNNYSNNRLSQFPKYSDIAEQKWKNLKADYNPLQSSTNTNTNNNNNNSSDNNINNQINLNKYKNLTDNYQQQSSILNNSNTNILVESTYPKIDYTNLSNLNQNYSSNYQQNNDQYSKISTDNQSLSQKYLVQQQFTPTLSSKQLIEQQQQYEVLCSKTGKKCEFICLDDGKFICSLCAVFEYKNKKLIPESDFTKDYKVFINEFNQTSNLMKDQAYQYFNDTKNIQAQKNQFVISCKLNELINKTSSQFQILYQELRKQEELCINEIKETLSKYQNTNSDDSIKIIQNKISELNQELQQVPNNRILSETSYQQQVQVYKKKDFYLQMLQQLKKQLEYSINLVDNNIDDSVKAIKINFKEQWKIGEKIYEIVSEKVKNSGQEQNNKMLIHSSSMIEKPHQNQKNNQINPIKQDKGISQIVKTENKEKINDQQKKQDNHGVKKLVPTKSDQDLLRLKTEESRSKTPQIKQDITKSNQPKQQNIRNISQHTTVKKLKNLNEKVEQVILQLQKGIKIDMIDLSNQNVDDSDLQQLSIALHQYNNNIGNIKLVKNKITDTGLQYMLQGIDKSSSVHTLNLTNNLCSMGCIEIVMKYLGQTSIKNLYLSHNKIIANQLRTIQAEMIEKGLNLIV